MRAASWLSSFPPINSSSFTLRRAARVGAFSPASKPRQAIRPSSITQATSASRNPRFRPQDRFGLAYFQYSLTDELVDDIAFRLGIEDEQGVEAFYTYQFADSLGITANVQVVDSAVAFRDTGVTVGARLTAQF